MGVRAFLFTTGDGRPSANAFWIDKHLAIIPKVEAAFAANGIETVWLHDRKDVVSSEYQAISVGREFLDQRDDGDILVDLTTGWNFPEHFGVVITMCQEHIRAGRNKLLLACNMEPKAPGYVAARANALIAEIMELPYTALTVIDQSDKGWCEFTSDLGSFINGSLKVNIPSATIATSAESDRIASDAIRSIRESGGVVPIINPSSMTMAQGWPHYALFKRLGLTPIAIGSNQFQADMAAVPLDEVLDAYTYLEEERWMNFKFTEGGLCIEEIFAALRMYLAKLEYWKQGAIGMGTQGQLDMTNFGPATDLSEALMMSSLSPGKEHPVIDVTESDCEALWTSLLMQAIIRVKYGTSEPIGFHDVRFYNQAQDTLVLLNSGSLALDFMTDTPGDYSDIYAVSQNRNVYFPHGGASTRGNMRPYKGANMFRAHGRGMGYRMQATVIDILPLDWKKRDQVYGELDYGWPMGIVEVPGGNTKDVTLSWVPNHAQHCNADIIAEMKSACYFLDIPFHCYAR